MYKATEKELKELLVKGCVVFKRGHEIGTDEVPQVAYHSDIYSFCTEEFPITVPDFPEAINFWDTVEKWEASSGDTIVSDCETSRDHFSPEKKITIFSRKDLLSWKEMLECILSNYYE